MHTLLGSSLPVCDACDLVILILTCLGTKTNQNNDESKQHQELLYFHANIHVENNWWIVCSLLNDKQKYFDCKYHP